MAPILFPLATKIGIHPVHLGVLMIVNTEVGLCHPQVGLNLYIASGICQNGDQRNHRRGAALAVRDAGVSRAYYTHPGNIVVAPAGVGHDLKQKITSS